MLRGKELKRHRLSSFKAHGRCSEDFPSACSSCTFGNAVARTSAISRVSSWLLLFLIARCRLWEVCSMKRLKTVLHKKWYLDESVEFEESSHINHIVKYPREYHSVVSNFVKNTCGANRIRSKL